MVTLLLKLPFILTLLFGLPLVVTLLSTHGHSVVQVTAGGDENQDTQQPAGAGTGGDGVTQRPLPGPHQRHSAGPSPTPLSPGFPHAAMLPVWVFVLAVSFLSQFISLVLLPH